MKIGNSQDENSLENKISKIDLKEGEKITWNFTEKTFKLIFFMKQFL